MELINRYQRLFLTVHAVISSISGCQHTNNIASNTLSADPYFMHKAGRYFRERLNGVEQNLWANYYSSSYDREKGVVQQHWTKWDNNHFLE
jgi:hypothetical protein